MGEMLPGMSYLVRRLLENTSNESWLRGKFVDNKSRIELLSDPHSKLSQNLEAYHQLERDPTTETPSQNEEQHSSQHSNKNSSQSFNQHSNQSFNQHSNQNSGQNSNQNQRLSYQKPSVFYNEPFLDFTQAWNREQLLQALARQKNLGAVHVPLVLQGESSWTTEYEEHFNPNTDCESVTRVSLGSHSDADRAIKAARQGWRSWKKRSFQERAAFLNTAADLMLKYRFDIIATQILEVGKPWAEADADLAEAVDFCRYYAREALHFDSPSIQGREVPGETSLYVYEPRGVTLVISPWNFPFAILTGQVVSALVTGNTVIMKPAEQSSRTGHWLMKILLEAGLPSDVAHFLPGRGEELGAYLVQHPQIHTISFTGSQAVGLWIAQKAHELSPGQTHLKRCLIEMGGKNAMIIDSDADLDEALGAVIYSAFGFSGQKCSACSRVLVLESIYDRFLERLIQATASLEVGSSENPKVYTGPVVDKQAQARILGIIEEAKKNPLAHRWEFTLPTPSSGSFVGPTIFSGVDPQSDLAQKEIFGPVLSVIKVTSIEEAVTVANNTEYALTGGLFSRSPQVIQWVQDHFECGNLYINRGITGAYVDRHPFGGFKLSGLGSKAGGPDYLTQFMDARVITENTMRRGFTPEL
jgi:RHH-type transcriptional regulator, proline utilization regulon repressor / proline dehydrogenase / delta 1-pyrroline-5-carboxylate dehydrogenase